MVALGGESMIFKEIYLLHGNGKDVALVEKDSGLEGIWFELLLTETGDEVKVYRNIYDDGWLYLIDLKKHILIEDTLYYQFNKNYEKGHQTNITNFGMFNPFNKEKFQSVKVNHLDITNLELKQEPVNLSYEDIKYYLLDYSNSNEYLVTEELYSYLKPVVEIPIIASAYRLT